VVLNDDVVRALGISERALKAAIEKERPELIRREGEYRGNRAPPDLRDRTVVLVDDGLATGATMRAAVRAVRKQGPKKIVVAVPVAAASTCEDLRSEVDELACLETPEPFLAVGRWYEDFSQTTDAEVRDLLNRAAAPEAVSVQKGTESHG
jgi:predicted phosphoribosyltransferase